LLHDSDNPDTILDYATFLACGGQDSLRVALLTTRALCLRWESGESLEKGLLDLWQSRLLEAGLSQEGKFSVWWRCLTCTKCGLSAELVASKVSK
jgi:hypothetical protein